MSPVEVWLTQKNLTVRCMIVGEDERAEILPLKSLNLRGAQREITAHLLAAGGEAVGRWEVAAPGETLRHFRMREAARNGAV